MTFYEHISFPLKKYKSVKMYLLSIYPHDILTQCGKALKVLHFFRQSINYINTFNTFKQGIISNYA